MKMTPRDKISRRDLLGGIGLGGLGLGGIGLGGIAAAQAAQAALLPTPRTLTRFDVVVVGTGLSGCVAALEAAAGGARVAVLEKADGKRAGGNSALAGGYFAIPTADAPDARAAYVEDFVAKGLGRGNRDIYALMADNVRADVAWLSDNKVAFTPQTGMPPYRVAAVVAAPGPYMGMPRLLKGLRDRISATGGVFFFGTKARQLILDQRAAVAGVRAVGPDGVADYAAPAVILAAGGYAANTRMLEAYADPNAGALMVRGNAWATGDGLAMAQEAGAGLRGMGGLTSLHVAAVDPVETAAGNPFAAVAYGLAVNRDGKRFVDEALGYVALGKAVLKQPGQSAALILDAGAGALPGPASALATFTRLGIATIRAGSLAELARRIGVPEAALEGTIAEFNAAVADGTAAGIQPPRHALARRVETPPFHAFHPLVPGVTLTFGGIMIDSRARVLEADGRVIGGLYACGEGAGAVFFDDYIGGGSLANGLVMGRIAGREAARTAGGK